MSLVFLIGQLRSQAGTLRYTSPEVLEGCVNLNNDWCLIQGDVYALGLLLWELWARCSDLYAGDHAQPVPVCRTLLLFSQQLSSSTAAECTPFSTKSQSLAFGEDSLS